MLNSNYNPDILTCLANLSNDEVFTPPKLANEILDQLPIEVWADMDARFLDPACKSGIFLREIAKRLDVGLEKSIPDRQERLNHIFSKQLYGIPITELTSQLSRRSVYCSKAANGTYSVCEEFDDEQGNIIFNRVEHMWTKGRCNFCGASQKNYERDKSRETHAYQFIHVKNPEDIFKMKFDVIVGNPPYQLSDGGGGGGTSAIPIYHKFIEQALKLDPRYLVMIVPSRWFSGGRGLDAFRSMMLSGRRLVKIFDFIEASDCFPGVQIKGGVNYFLMSKEESELCEISTFRDGKFSQPLKRPLQIKGLSTFIRHNEAISILEKVQKFNEPTFEKKVSAQKPFGFRSNFSDYRTKQSNQSPIKLYRNENDGYVNVNQITKNKDLINKIKVIISKAGSGSDTFPHQILGVPFISEPTSICTETYIIIGIFDNLDEAKNLITYVSTRFFRFFVSLIKNTQNVSRNVFSLVPEQDYAKPWSDELLYQKYGITDDEIDFIESMIRPMDRNGE